MDWVKVVKALDDEWWNRSQAAQKHSGPDGDGLRRTAGIAFMLRDCLIVGLSEDDRKRLEQLMARR